eukprot:13119977-Alexandrium_andersonii.AAC.1
MCIRDSTRSTWGGSRSVAPFRTGETKWPTEPGSWIAAATAGWGGGPAGSGDWLGSPAAAD